MTTTDQIAQHVATRAGCPCMRFALEPCERCTHTSTLILNLVREHVAAAIEVTLIRRGEGAFSPLVDQVIQRMASREGGSPTNQQ